MARLIIASHAALSRTGLPPGTFYVLFGVDDGYYPGITPHPIYKLVNGVPAETNTGDVTLYQIDAPSVDHVVTVNLEISPPYLDDIRFSVDSAASFASGVFVGYQTLLYNKHSMEHDTVHYDLSNSDLVWVALNSTLAPSYDHVYSYAYCSQDKGETWTNFFLDSVPILLLSGTTGFVAPRHNNADAFVVAGYNDSYNTQRIYLVDKTGASTYHVVSGIDTTLGATRYGYPDQLFLQGVSSGHLVRYAWSTNTLDDLGFAVAATQILATRSGAILIFEQEPSSTPPYVFLRLHRTDDGGATFSTMDLSSYLPVRGAMAGFDYASINSNNTIFIPFENGHGIFSIDDGLTWKRTPDFMTHDVVWDVRGAG